MKGIILAGGSGTRLYPLTRVTSKQLLPVYDKPMIYYPLSTLMLAGIRDILIISTPHDLPNFEKLLGDGSQFGVSFTYQVQEHPDGLPQAFILGASFIGRDNVCLILGDNIFYGNHFTGMLREAVENTEKNHRATVFGTYVNDPERYGVAELDETGRVLSLEEKPAAPKSNYAVTGLYFFDNRVIEYARTLKPSGRNELEIMDLCRIYLNDQELDMRVLGRGFAYMDTGTIDSLSQAGDYVRLVEEVQGIKISVPEEIAYYNGWITVQQVLEAADQYGHSPYGTHLRKIAAGSIRTTYTKKERR